MQQEYYLHVYHWCETLLSESQNRPLIVGVSGMQGIGKSTLTSHLVRVFKSAGVNTLTISIDDFYLTRSEQVKLAKANPNNPYLQQRGYPGTHDVTLGVSVLEHLKTLGAGETFAVPNYDKSKNEGKGDRRSKAEWTTVTGSLDLIIFEGWMLGFDSVELPPQSGLAQTNSLLRNYEIWNRLLDAFVFLDPIDTRFVLKWRVEAEEKMKAQGKSGMTNEEVIEYAKLFLPAYETYLPGLRKNFELKFRRSLRLLIGEDRLAQGCLDSSPG
jgi:D-glycerate 3-kinase